MPLISRRVHISLGSGELNEMFRELFTFLEWKVRSGVDDVLVSRAPCPYVETQETTDQ